MTVATADSLLRGLAEAAQDEYFPLRLGFMLNLKDFGSFGQALVTSPSWNDWCETINAHHATIGLQGSFLKIDAVDDKIAIAVLQQDASAISLVQFYIGVIIKLLMLSCSVKDRHDVRSLTEIRGLLKKLSGLDVTSIDKPDCSLSVNFENPLLQKPPHFANRRVHGVFIRDLCESGDPGQSAGIAIKIQALLGNLSSLQSINQQWVAEKLHMSERNLLRKLTTSGVSFRDLFNKVRSKRALDLLFTGCSIADISDRLGYSERATFERAFKNWQGITPVAMQSRFARLSAEQRLDTVISPEMIPVPPTMLMKLIALLGDSDYHMEELASLVESDPVLTSKVLAVANSALFGYKGITTVKQAILTVLGTEKLQAIVIGILSSEAFGTLPEWFPYSKFWFRSLASANLASVLMQATQASEYEKLVSYLSALLHNIGEIALVHCLSDSYEELVREGLYELEWYDQLNLQRLRLGLHSVQVSEIVLNIWDFPADISTRLRQSGLCDDFIDDGKDRSASAVSVASSIVAILDARGDDTEVRCRTQIEAFLDKYNSADVKIEPLLEKVHDTLQTLEENAFEFDIL